MAYKIGSSERLRHSASETETKAMLYLMNFRDDSDEIHYFIVDFFNDLTGMDRMSQKLWDLQSKAASNSSPKAIGQELVTLFKNFLSDFTFDHYILFMGEPSNTLRRDSTKTVFGIDNVTDSGQERLIEGLREEALVKTYIDNASVTDVQINLFLQKVLFVIDNKPPYEYVKAIIKIHPSLIPSDDILAGIFNEIRDKQASKKNNIPVEGIIIQTSDEALNYCRHLTNCEIKTFVLGRIINRDPFQRGIPISFVPICSHFPPEVKNRKVEDCQLALSMALFDKNSAEFFWQLFEEIYRLIIGNPNDDVDTIFQEIDVETKRKNSHFDVLSLKYFIANIKDGIQV